MIEKKYYILSNYIISGFFITFKSSNDSQINLEYYYISMKNVYVHILL